MTNSWLETPEGAAWPTADSDETNPFVRYRELLWSWHRWVDSGLDDNDFVAMVHTLDDSVKEVAGTGFVTTPARWVDSLGEDSQAPVFAKDETGNVGGSHKARHLMGLLLHFAVDAVANNAGTNSNARLAISSCGNAALGAATVARAANRPIDVFIPTWADPKVVALLDSLEATIHVCERRVHESGDPCMLRFQEAVSDGALPFGVQATENLWTLDGGRTIGWELADQLGADSVDHVFVQVGGGALLTSCAIGLLEGAALGPLERVPRVWAVQSEGCAPFDRAWSQIPAAASVDERLRLAEQQADRLMTPWSDPSSSATGILDDVTYDWLGVARVLLETGGSSVLATEDDIESANQRVRSAGYNADHTGSAGYAGLLAALREGSISPTDTTAVLITGIRR
ncbi:MAG: pyridoxal-phosphate dependent enzyme [Acidimicrobiaceae bacterium]|nr:pyridoxal-phosphate dependent enzyme [Acidimicrobiaceae bacterium]MYD06613.1 pyridoxal-phosphate dependent enzyme [Acidimicrobiaceae bacterium]MYI57529.1 pyridoxal-phosphate dependent enzyme [Acidimicrobiaceae bacterium]